MLEKVECPDCRQLVLTVSKYNFHTTQTEKVYASHRRDYSYLCRNSMRKIISEDTKIP